MALKPVARKVRVASLLQSEMSECGLTCVAMVAKYYQPQVELGALRSLAGMSSRGTTLGGLVKVAAHCGLLARPLRVELAGLEELSLPSILHWNFNHFVVLTGVGREGIRINDPASGARTVGWDETSTAFTGVAVELEKAFEFSCESGQSPLSIRKILRAAPGLMRALAQIFAISLFIELLVLLIPLGTQAAIDAVTTTYDTSLLFVIFLAIIAVAIVRVAFSSSRTWLVARLSNSLNLQILANMFEHILKLPITFFERRHKGDIISRFVSASSLRNAVTSTFVEAVLDGIFTIITLVVLIIYSPLLALAPFLGVLLYIAVRSALFPRMRRVNTEEVVQTANEQTTFIDSLTGIQSIKLGNMEEDRRNIWVNQLTGVMERVLARERINIVQNGAQLLITGTEQGIVIFLGFRAVLAGSLSLGMLVAFFGYRLMFVERVKTLIDRVFEVRLLGVHFTRMLEIVAEAREEGADDPVRSDWWKGSAARLTARGLRFRYSEDEPWIMNDLNLDVHPGECVAIVGPTGCGKTSLLKILMGLYAPQTGVIDVNGCALSSVGTRTYRSGVAAVMQDDHLLSGSIAQNIAGGAPNIDMERVLRAARLAAIHDDISRMPMKYETIVGDSGCNFSAGQKQRIYLARALYKEPHILFLDEASSNLDVITERAINENIRFMNTTRIIVAHRPDTILYADRIFSMSDGKLKEMSGLDADSIKELYETSNETI